MPSTESREKTIRTNCINCGVSLLKNEGHIRYIGKDYCGTCYVAADTLREQPYSIIPPLTFTLNKDDPSDLWSVADTLALLDAVAKVGVGSWDEVLRRMRQAGAAAGTSSSIDPPKCRARFMSLYSSWEASSSPKKSDVDDTISNQVMEDNHCAVMNPMADHDGPVVDTVLGKRKRSDVSTGNDSDQFIPGYTPRRGDFEVDYDDCAELLLADMEFQPDERKEDEKVKVDVLLAYNARLSLREQMKRYVVRREMIMQKPPPVPVNPRSGGGVPPLPPVNANTRAGQILNRLFRPVERFFNSNEDCDEFKQLLLEEQRIINRLHELDGSSSSSLRPVGVETDGKSNTGVAIPDAWMRKHNLRKRRVNKEVVKAECAKTLSDQEIQWCREVDVSPHHFALIRDALIHEAINGQDAHAKSSMVLRVSRAEPLSRTFKLEVSNADRPDQHK